jgi:hypothetical protein
MDNQIGVSVELSVYTCTVEAKLHAHSEDNDKPHEEAGPSPVAGGVSP